MRYMRYLSLIALVAVLTTPSTASAHTVTRTACAQAAQRTMVATPPHTTQQRGATFRRCMSFSTRHAAAHQLRQCDSLRLGKRSQWHVTRNACRIKITWPGDWQAAVTVAWCEGSLHPDSSNGQYKGTFQMGSDERRKWGHGSTVPAQAIAARRYYSYARKIGWSGGWGPWSCKPGSYDNQKAWRRASAALIRYVY